MESSIVIQSLSFFHLDFWEKEVQTLSIYCPREANPGLHSLIENSDLSHLYHPVLPSVSHEGVSVTIAVDD